MCAYPRQEKNFFANLYSLGQKVLRLLIPSWIFPGFSTWLKRRRWIPSHGLQRALLPKVRIKDRTVLFVSQWKVEVYPDRPFTVGPCRWKCLIEQICSLALPTHSIPWILWDILQNKLSISILPSNSISLFLSMYISTFLYLHQAIPVSISIYMNWHKLCLLLSSGDCSWVSGGWLPCRAVLRWNPASCLPRRKRPADGKNGWRLVPWQQQQHCWYLRPVVPSAGLLKIQCERKSTAGIVGLAAVCAPSPGIFVDTCSYW